MGHPGYDVTDGSVIFRDQDLLSQKPEQRAVAGLFLSFQYPQSVAGVTLGNFLRLAYNATHEPKLSVGDFLKLLKEKMQLLGLDESWISRPVNEGASGGEKKRAEMLQLAVLQPKLAILDETDSGLDIDALRIVGAALQKIREVSPNTSFLLITHHQRLLEYLKPDRVAVMKLGKIVKSGGLEILEEVETSGFKDLSE